MRVDLPLFAAALATLVGFMAFWANPKRRLNRLFFTLSVHVSLWLIALHVAFGSSEGLFWVRITSAIGALVPFHFWAIQQCMAGTAIDRRYWTGAAVWSGIGVFLAVLPFTDFFIPSHSTTAQRLYGMGYYGYIGAILLLYGTLALDAWRGVRKLTGGQKLELQIWLTSATVAAATMLALMAISAATGDRQWVRLQPLVVVAFYTATATIMTTHRVFDARQLLSLGVEKLVLVSAVAAFAYGVDVALRQLLPSTFAFFGTTAVTLWFAVTLNAWLDRMFHFYPQATAARQAAFAAAQGETRNDALESAFHSILTGWGQTDRAVILVRANRSKPQGRSQSSADATVERELQQLHWATPERLARERHTPDRAAVGRFLAERDLGIVVSSVGPALSVLIGVGRNASRRPYTYPQVLQLMELASIMESAFERAHLALKVQHAEQLATVGLLGASMAHEIRNPLVTIKTFVQLLPAHYQDPKFRDKFFHLIADEVDRIDRLTEQLLDLASPRTYQASTIELHPVLRASLDLVATKAAHREVQIVADFTATPDVVFTDAAAAKQVVLNLCLNAIQALDGKEDGERRMWIATRNTSGGVEVSVTDSGPGIAPEIMPRLFQPFQTTKSSGFGLGLAICSDILANLNATISVDPPVSGRGATFRVIFPCQPSLS